MVATMTFVLGMLARRIDRHERRLVEMANMHAEASRELELFERRIRLRDEREAC